MTRKKKQPPQQKRQQVTDPSGWTYITKGPKNNMTSIAQLSSQRLQTSLTIEDYAKKFNSEYRPQWQESACLQSLTQVLEQHVLPARNVALTKCICLGLGSLLVGNPTSSYELAALISMLDILSYKHEIQEVIFQDPAFNARDHVFLESLGYTVLSDPEAFSKIDDQTFLFAPHLDCDHLATALENAAPALCICNNLNDYITTGTLAHCAEEKKKGSGRIFEIYVNRTESKAMPEFDRTTWCQYTHIYWLKAEEVGSVDEAMGNS